MPACTPWLLSCANTHMYSGVQLRILETEGRLSRWHEGDAVLIEFSDLTLGHGRLWKSALGWTLQLNARKTARGASIASQVWQMQFLEDQPDTIRLTKN